MELPISIGENKKVIRLTKDELDGILMKWVVSLRAKMYSKIADDGCVSKKANNTKKYTIKRKINFQDCKVTKSAWRMIKQYWNTKKGLGVYSMSSLKRSTRLNSVQMMIRE